MDGRLYLSKQAHKIYQENCVEGKLFSQFTDMFFWCAILGYKNSPDSIPPEINKGGTFFWTAFDDEIQKPVLKTICVQAAGNFNILSPDPQTKGYERFRDILERYAELGFMILNTRLGGNYSKDNMDKLMDLLIESSDVGLK
ncbi:MAG: hypothetical protein UZ01_01688 [Candidatus Brocadia sinica]|nr:MAG: hypothetical protein UZ01_01688 [Candidatus Brocadia sinica]MCK6466902.1 hypothetical protein [Candidatus Brocadia sinica]